MTNRIRGVIVAGMVVGALGVPAHASDPMSSTVPITRIDTMRVATAARSRSFAA